jgi:hypothetical protein
MDGRAPAPSADAAVDAEAPDAAPFVCEVVAPTACPEPSLTYKDVGPVIKTRCASCHDGRGEQWPLASYSDVADWCDQIRSMVQDCSMPPPDAGIRMPAEERELILTWIRCGYPE